MLITTFLEQSAVYAPAILATLASSHVAFVLADAFSRPNCGSCER